MSANELSQWLRERRDQQRAVGQARFFQVFPGGYAEHDRFLGIPVPTVREGVRMFRGIPPTEAVELVVSQWHEERLAGLLSWVDAFARTKTNSVRLEIADLYLRHKAHIDNWDLVDSSAHFILGPWWEEHPDPSTFWKLATSDVLWERRIAVISTFHAIRNRRPEACVDICEALLTDKHDLIHKATGWMLREAGKRDPEVLHEFLRLHAHEMPRTMLRYSIEKLPREDRLEWMRR